MQTNRKYSVRHGEDWRTWHVKNNRRFKKKKQIKKKITSEINPCCGCGQIHYYKDVHLEGKSALIVAKKVTSIHTAESQKIKEDKTEKYSQINSTRKQMKRKYVKVQMNNKEVKFKLDTGSNVTLINEKTWKKIGRQTLLKTEKIAYGITGNKLEFVGQCYTNVTFMGKTLKSKGFIMNRTQYLFGLNWIIRPFEPTN